MILKMLLSAVLLYVPSTSKIDSIIENIIQFHNSTVVNHAENNQSFSIQRARKVVTLGENKKEKDVKKKSVSPNTKSNNTQKQEVPAQKKEPVEVKQKETEQKQEKKVENNVVQNQDKPVSPPEKKKEEKQQEYKDKRNYTLPFSIDHYNKEFLTKLNNLRKSKGLPPVVINPTLIRSAMIRSEENRTLNDIDHTRPNGKKFSTSYPGKYNWIAENLAGRYVTNRGEDNTEAVFRSWVNSPGHYSTMISPNTKEMGIGVVAGDYLVSGDGVLLEWPSEYWTLHVRKP